MNRLFRTLSIFAAVAFSISACNAEVFPVSREERATPKAAHYKDLLGKSLTEKVVADFIARNHCSSIMPYILCKEVGMDLLIGANQIVEGVFLYLNKSVGFVPSEGDFNPYQGELPLGLKFYDTMAAVEYKLKQQGIGNAGLPDLEGTPDHMHYVATYKQIGITIIYNSPPDEDALIYAILVRE